ncbi:MULTISPECIES: siderophore-interacting protein [Vibrio]|uniref:siderophore-interacting protein n=1 Tax=Vibrio TaxID=662 RepID=UPI003D09C490
MKKPSPKLLTLIHSESLTPNMRRLTLQSEALKTWDPSSNGSYIKFLFNEHGGTALSDLSEDSRPKMRTYTIRALDIEHGKIEVDFVTHITEDKLCGFGSRWAMDAKIGDQISIVGPGAIQSVNTDKDWFFFNADMTALPALSVKLAELPAEAKGYAIIQLIDVADQQTLTAPQGMDIIWTTEPVSKIAMLQPWLNGEPYVWCACEFDEMKKLRQFFRNDKAIPKDDIYISSYWKKGVAEDGHKVIKKQDHDEFEG